MGQQKMKSHTVVPLQLSILPLKTGKQHFGSAWQHAVYTKHTTDLLLPRTDTYHPHDSTDVKQKAKKKFAPDQLYNRLHCCEVPVVKQQNNFDMGMIERFKGKHISAGFRKDLWNSKEQGQF